MNKKVWVGFIVVYVVLMLTNFLVYGVLLKSELSAPDVAATMRPPETAKTGVHFLAGLFVAFFVTLIFSKGYEGKGIMEGVRYGAYVGFLMAVPMAYETYAVFPLPYHFALLWFIYGFLQYVIIGIVLAMVFGTKKPAPAV